MSNLRGTWEAKIGFRDRSVPYTAIGTTLYGGGRGIVTKSTDDWATQTLLHNLPNYPSLVTAMHALSNDALLIATLDGGIYKSVPPYYSSSRKVLQMAVPDAHAQTWSFASKDGLVFAAEYGPITENAANNATRVYKSSDYGETWTLVYTLPHDGLAHCHKILIDPTTDIAWLCNGDAPHRYVRKLLPPDYTTAEVAVNGIQPTGGVVVGDKILWAQDSGPYGIYLMDKSTYELNLVLDLTQYPEYDGAGYNALMQAPDGTVYYATHPDHQVSRGFALFKSVAPYTEWEFLHGCTNPYIMTKLGKGVRTFASVSNNKIIGNLNYKLDRYISIIFTPWKANLRS